jgi:uncharacterized protein
MNTLKKVLLIFILLFVPFHFAYGDDGIKYPKPTEYKYVTDYVNILEPDIKGKIISLGDELYKKTKAEIVVVTIGSLPENTDIDTYANGLFRDWGIGNKELNNGVLLLVSANDRKMRIEVGYGLEGAIPDAVAGSISDNYIIPYFSKGDYNTGIFKGYSALCDRAAKEYNIELSGGTINTDDLTQDINKTNINIPLIIAVVLLLIFDGVFLRFRILRFIFLIMLSGRRGGRGGRGGFGGGSGGGFGGFGGGSSGGGGAGRGW